MADLRDNRDPETLGRLLLAERQRIGTERFAFHVLHDRLETSLRLMSLSSRNGTEA